MPKHTCPSCRKDISDWFLAEFRKEQSRRNQAFTEKMRKEAQEFERRKVKG